MFSSTSHVVYRNVLICKIEIYRDFVAGNFVHLMFMADMFSSASQTAGNHVFIC